MLGVNSEAFTVTLVSFYMPTNRSIYKQGVRIKMRMCMSRINGFSTRGSAIGVNASKVDIMVNWINGIVG
jgi:hypothetical protein